MKKIFSLVIFGLFLSLGLTSCKGDSPEPPMPPAAQGKKLVGYVDSEGITIKTIKYDTRGRIIFISAIRPDDETNKMVESNFTYHYTSDSIIISMSDPDGSNVISIKCELDSKGRVSKMFVPEVYDEEAVMYLFTYDKNNQLINSYASDNESQTITWSEGNITGIVNQHKKVTTQTMYTYTDYNAKHFINLGAVDGTPDILGVEGILFWQGYFGAYPKNLVKTSSVVGDDDKTTFTYKLDDQGYVVKASNSDDDFCVFTWK